MTTACSIRALSVIRELRTPSHCPLPSCQLLVWGQHCLWSWALHLLQLPSFVSSPTSLERRPTCGRASLLHACPPCSTLSPHRLCLSPLLAHAAEIQKNHLLTEKWTQIRGFQHSRRCNPAGHPPLFWCSSSPTWGVGTRPLAHGPKKGAPSQDPSLPTTEPSSLSLRLRLGDMLLR